MALDCIVTGDTEDKGLPRPTGNKTDQSVSLHVQCNRKVPALSSGPEMCGQLRTKSSSARSLFKTPCKLTPYSGITTTINIALSKSQRKLRTTA